jgi:hypothetical protein
VREPKRYPCSATINYRLSNFPADQKYTLIVPGSTVNLNGQPNKSFIPDKKKKKNRDTEER